MSNKRFSPEFKDEAVRQVVDRGGLCICMIGTSMIVLVIDYLGIIAHAKGIDQ